MKLPFYIKNAKPKIRLRKRTKRRMVRFSLVFVNIAFLAAMTGFVITSSGEQKNTLVTSLSATDVEVSSPLDQLSSADIAANVAQLANLYETQSVINNADTVNAQLSIVPADDKVIAKPQLVTSDVKSVIDIAEHTVADNETMTQIAEKYGVTSDSIRWSNSMTSNVISAGDVLTIPPIDGIVYVVEEGDTAADLAQKYNSDKAQIISFNDAEVDGLPVGEQIVIPGAIQPVRRTYDVNTSVYTSGGFAWGGYAPVYGGGGYDYGYCTWYAAIRRSQAGRPLPSNLGNASTWRVLAERAGLATGSTPASGAIIWTPPTDYYGHVGYVEEVYADGSIRVSEMNVVGWGVRSEKTLTASEAARFSYIY